MPGKPRFLITIDTEGDNLWSRPKDRYNPKRLLSTAVSGAMRKIWVQADLSHQL